MNQLDARQLVMADLLTGLIVSGIGVTGLILSVSMPRFAERNADPLTAPGIFPALVSLVLLILGSRLVLRSWPLKRSRAAVVTPMSTAHSSTSDMHFRPLLIGFSMMLLTVILVGRIDFKLLISGFCILFCVSFVSWHGDRWQLVRTLAVVLLVALIAGVAIPLVFERLFLVRLPG